VRSGLVAGSLGHWVGGLLDWADVGSRRVELCWVGFGLLGWKLGARSQESGRSLGRWVAGSLGQVRKSGKTDRDHAKQTAISRFGLGSTSV
jgi:hypothetical protein